MSAETDPLPAAVRRYLQARANQCAAPSDEAREIMLRAATDAMSLALAQHGKVEALHAAAVAVAEHDLLCHDLFSAKCTDMCAAVYAAYRAAKAALAESNQEAARAESGDASAGRSTVSPSSPLAASTSAHAMSAEQRILDEMARAASMGMSFHMPSAKLLVQEQIRAAETQARCSERAAIIAAVESRR